MSLLFRRLVALAGGVLVRVGMLLEDAAEPPPDLDAVDSCARCRNRVVLTVPQLAGLVRNAAEGVPPQLIAWEARTLYWTPR